VSVPNNEPSTYICTLATPTLSAAETDTIVVPFIIAPSAGELIETVGAVASMVTLLSVEAGEVFPALSVAFAVILCVPLLIAVDGATDHEPELDVTALTNGVVLVPSYSLTVDDASAVPVNVGVLSLVVLPLAGLDITGAAGAMVSIVMLTATEAGDVLPAASTAFAVIL
jgi:hypothetical protein